MKFFVYRLSKIKEKATIFLLCGIITLGTVYTARHNALVCSALPIEGKTVIIDPGHGGWDPGKTGTIGENEKNINLKVSGLLQQYLEQSGATVLVTRNADEALGTKKREDMRNRKIIANGSSGDVFISIHQNSFTKENTHGAQVFYHRDSTEGQRLAKCIQRQLRENADPGNKRVEKPNMDYYILKNTELPAVIVECGFLSNPTEETKLNTEEYQSCVAWAVYMGILDYFGESSL